MPRQGKSALKLINFSEVTDYKPLVFLYYRWFNNPQIKQYLFPQTPSTKKTILSWLKETVSSPDQQYYLLYLPVQKVFIGHAGLKNIDLESKTAEIGLVIGEPSFWRQGWGTLAYQKIEKIARKAGIGQLVAEIMASNLPSQQFFRKAGFKAIDTPRVHIARHLGNTA